MALSWSTTDCCPQRPRDEIDRGNRDSLIFIGQHIAASDLTSATAREWFVRARVFEHWMGMKRDELFRNATLRQVLDRWTGLRVGVGFIDRTLWVEIRHRILFSEAEDEFSPDALCLSLFTREFELMQALHPK